MGSQKRSRNWDGEKVFVFQNTFIFDEDFIFPARQPFLLRKKNQPVFILAFFFCCLLCLPPTKQMSLSTAGAAKTQKERDFHAVLQPGPLLSPPPNQQTHTHTLSKPSYYTYAVICTKCTASSPTWYVETGEAAMKGVMEVCAIMRLVAML